MTRPATLGALRAAGYPDLTVKQELRRNLLRALKSGETLFPGIIGYDRTVIPQLVNAILSRHDVILLGLRGQAKTRLLRSLTRFLDEYIPVVAGSEISDHPYHPVSAFARRVVGELGDATPIEWVHRDRRYHEKLATPDVTIADLIGDIDPIKAAAKKLDFSSEEVIHYGLVPRANRGIFAINELPDLQARIQVGLLNVMQEKDVQIRGFDVRLPLDVAIVYSANPEDYTNRGTIITPLKDRIDSQIMTHYPEDLAQAMAITDQEAWTERDGGARLVVPEWIREVIEEIAFQARESDYVDQNSGVSARLSITALENVLSNMERRALKTGDDPVVARVADLQAAVPSLTGKLELVYEGEQEGPLKVAKYLIGRAVKEVFESHFPPAHRGKKKSAEREEVATSPYRKIVDWFSQGKKLEIGDEDPAATYFATLNQVPGLKDVAAKHAGTDDPVLVAPIMELILEGLHQSAILAKEEMEGQVRFLDMFQTMLSNLGDQKR
jgi:magnesium chelatase subunit I